MKIALPTKDELGRWMTGGSVLCAASSVKAWGRPDFVVVALSVWLIMAGAVLLYLTIRANVYAAFASRQRRKIARQ